VQRHRRNYSAESATKADESTRSDTNSSKNLPDGKCVAVFADRLVGPAYLEVFDPFGNLAQRLSKTS